MAQLRACDWPCRGSVTDRMGKISPKLATTSSVLSVQLLLTMRTSHWRSPGTCRFRRLARVSRSEAARFQVQIAMVMEGLDMLTAPAAIGFRGSVVVNRRRFGGR